jgi:hypothetical protein
MRSTKQTTTTESRSRLVCIWSLGKKNVDVAREMTMRKRGM